MPPINSADLEHQLKRWMRPDAHHFVRPDWRRFVRPGFEDGHPFALYERKYSPEQPRDDHGRWTSEGAPIQTADSGFGRLIAEIPGPGGRRCVYQFGTFTIMIPGPMNFRYPTSVHASATTHGIRLNDN